MSSLAVRLRDHFYDRGTHPYRVFERLGESLIRPDTPILMDAGCGRTSLVLRKFLGRIERLIGVEMVEFADVPPGIEMHNADLGALRLLDAALDLRPAELHLSKPVRCSDNRSHF